MRIDRKLRAGRVHARCVGFTLIETLVVICILGILASLLVPAVQSARESGRRAGCANNLKNIGIALASSHATNQTFPAGMRPSALGSSRLYSVYPFSVHSEILPYLDNSALYNHINFMAFDVSKDNMNASIPVAANATVLNLVVETFLCSSDSARYLLPGCSYRATTGPNPFEQEGSKWVGGGGAFPGLKATRSQEFLDGLANTVGFSERVIGSSESRGYNKYRDVVSSNILTVTTDVDSDLMNSVCSGLAGAFSSFWSRSGERWLRGGFEFTLYSHVADPSGKVSDCSAGGPIVEGELSGGSVSAHSYHSGSVTCLFMDGTVRPVAGTINLMVWRALSTRAGGEVVKSGP
ncbi:prepilin-type N-terminal cleavage/methylation domain-containing protein [Singulisphaera sp. GP187]|uniref:DUF1559 family PulG-like putative transporter n=1 Tax=Singulisphaera sp. GP187 TaxID=1882752 RepID=UPI0009272B27|nr:DUF1559 domain-containing protein [Singulisphaera sp. GP187]SIO66932.1 prepilin-type N-terminal cleavage/methylation domain-containing protein [Singulisphaera sp. GP187]